MDNNEKRWKKWLSSFTFCVLLIIIYKTLDNFSSIYSWIGHFSNIVMPFILAIIVAYIFYIPCRKVESLYLKSRLKLIKKKARVLSTATIYLIAALFIYVVVQFVFPTLAESIKDLASNLPSYYNQAINYVNELPEDSVLNQLNVKELVFKIQEINITEKILEILNFDNVGQYIKGVMGATGMIFDAFVTFVVSVYLILERNDIKSFLSNLSKVMFNKNINQKLSGYYEETNKIFFSFITSQCLDAIIVGIITSIAMSLLKVKYAVLLGFLIGLFNIIPYFGAIVAVFIAVMITIFTGGVAKAIWMAVSVVALQQIDANIINPRILGNSLHLSPILVIFSVTLFGSYFGVLGMFLAVPISAMIKLLLLDYIEERKKILELEKAEVTNEVAEDKKVEKKVKKVVKK